jgi:hypothetical protein
MNRQYLIYGGLVLGAVGLYFLFKNKNKGRELLDNLGINTQGNTTQAPTNSTPTLATPPLISNPVGNLSTTSDGVNPSDANVNLANATILAGERKLVFAQANARPYSNTPVTYGALGSPIYGEINTNVFKIRDAKLKLIELDKKLANLGYKVDATGSLVRI